MNAYLIHLEKKEAIPTHMCVVCVVCVACVCVHVRVCVCLFVSLSLCMYNL